MTDNENKKPEVKTSEELERELAEVRREYLDYFLTLPKIEKDKVVEFVNWLYRVTDHEEPKEGIIFAVSPVGAVVIANLVNFIEKMVVEHKVWNDEVWSLMKKYTRDRVGSVVNDNVLERAFSDTEEQFIPKYVAKYLTSQEDYSSDEINSMVKDQAKTFRYYDFAYYGNVWDYNWISFYDYFERIGVVNNEDFTYLRKNVRCGLYDTIHFEEVCIVCEFPTKVNIDEMGNPRLHSTGDSSLEWADGFVINHLHGVRFEEKKDVELWKKIVSGNMSKKELLSIENMEQRMVALKVMGPEKLLDEATLLDKSERGNELYRLDGVFDDPAYYLKYSCPSTKRIYVSGVDPEVGVKGVADAAMAWKHYLTLEEYQELRHES